MHCAHWDSEKRVRTHHPAMLARFWAPDGASSTIHRTYLTQDGQKAPVDPVRMLMPGDVPVGGAVRLMAPMNGSLVVGEGIETSLSAARLWSLPAWACLTAELLAAWVPPEGVEHVVIAGDNDASFAGQCAAYRLAQRLSRLGIAAEVRIAPEVGTDWNDVLAEALNA
jgi:putative DNA primase/helicase